MIMVSTKYSIQYSKTVLRSWLKLWHLCINSKVSLIWDMTHTLLGYGNGYILKTNKKFRHCFWTLHFNHYMHAWHVCWICIKVQIKLHMQMQINAYFLFLAYQCCWVLSQIKESKCLNKCIIYYINVDTMTWELWLN